VGCCGRIEWQICSVSMCGRLRSDFSERLMFFLSESKILLRADHGCGLKVDWECDWSTDKRSKVSAEYRPSADRMKINGPTL